MQLVANILKISKWKWMGSATVYRLVANKTIIKIIEDKNNLHCVKVIHKLIHNDTLSC